MAVGAEVADIAGAEVAVVVEGLGGERRVGVALRDHRALHAHLTVDAGRSHRAVLGDDAHVRSGHGCAGGVGELVVVVGGRPLRDHRDLGHAVAVADLDAHLGHDLVVQLGREWCAAAGQGAQRGNDRFGRLLALLGEEHLVERGRSAGHRDAVLLVRRDGLVGHEGLDDHGRHARDQHHDDVVGAGDVGDGEGDRAHVGGRHLEGVGQALPAGDQGRVGVLHTLGVRGGAGGGVDPAHGFVAVGRVGCRRQRRRVARRERPEGQHHGGRVEVGRELVGHGGVVEALPLARHDAVLGIGVLQDEAQLLLAVQVEDGALDGVEAAQRRHRDRGVDRRRELPGDAALRTDAGAGQTGGEGGGLVAELAEGHAAIGFVDEHHVIGGLARASLDELPDGRHVVSPSGPLCRLRRPGPCCASRISPRTARGCAIRRRSERTGPRTRAHRRTCVARPIRPRDGRHPSG